MLPDISDSSTGYQKHVLDNGTSIVSKYVPDSPLVTIQIRVLSGLSNEGKYAGTGISHFLEHLLFKGTENKDSKTIRKEIKAMGGTVNGSTGLDSAEYHITVPNENYVDAMNLLVEMVMEPVFTEQDMEKERDVVLNEIKMHEDNPSSKIMRLLFSQAYRDNVYKYPIIGYEVTFKRLTRDDILDYHAQVYTPDRIVLGVTGGIPSQMAIEYAERTLQRYTRRSSLQTVVSPEPRQVDEIRTEFKEDVALAYLAVGFHTTSLYSQDLYSGDVLSILLGGGNDSRLYKRLVKERELLYSITAFNYTPKYPGLFIIKGVGDPENMELARDEIFNVIDELILGKINREDLERTKNIVVSEYLHSHERIGSINSSMTTSEIVTGDVDFFEKYVTEIAKVEKDDVIKAVIDYLRYENSTSIILYPHEYNIPEAEDDIGIIGKRIKGGSSVDSKEEIQVLENGLRLIVKRRDQLPLVSVTFAAPGGLRYENKRTNGISNLTSSVVLKGTRRREEDEIVPALEKLGGIIRPFSGMNSIGVSMDLMSQDLKEGLDVFEDVIKNAVFPEEEILKAKKKIAAAMKKQKNDIFENGMIKMLKLLYGNHPYSMKILGNINTVDFLTREQLLSFYDEHFVPAGSVITVVGDVDPDEVFSTLTKRFSRWGEADYVRYLRKKVKTIEHRLTENLSMRKEQSLLLVGFQTVNIKDKRKYALSLISSLLSGSDGLLFYAAREKEGITYASGAVSVPQVDKGYFVLYVATSEGNIKKAKELIFSIIDQIKKGEISDEEITSSKNRLIAQHAQSLQSNSAISMTMSLDELYGLGAENYSKYSQGINSVTKEDILKCTRELLLPEKCAVIVVHSANRR